MKPFAAADATVVSAILAVVDGLSGLVVLLGSHRNQRQLFFAEGTMLYHN